MKHDKMSREAITAHPQVGPTPYGTMVGKSKDPKGTRITVRISDKDLTDLQAEARRKNVTVGAVVRGLIRECLQPEESTSTTSP
jgi:hypothetical protein